MIRALNMNKKALRINGKRFQIGTTQNVVKRLTTMKLL